MTEYQNPQQQDAVTRESPIDEGQLAHRIKAMIDDQLRYRGAIAPLWQTVAISGLAIGVFGWAGMMAIRLVMQPLNEGAVYALIDESIAQQIPPPSASADTVALQAQIDQLEAQLGFVRSQLGEDIRRSQTATAVVNTSVSPEQQQPSREALQVLAVQDSQILEAKRFRFAPNTYEGVFPLDIPQSSIQPVVADVGEGQNLAINDVPDLVSVIVYSTTGTVIEPSSDGTWQIPSTGDVTIDFIAVGDVSGSVRIAVR